MITFSRILTFAVVILVIVLQLKKFFQNRKRIKTFSQIFAGQAYGIVYHINDGQKDTIVGITGPENEIFDDIKESINGYLNGTQGTEVDFQLLKDSVDRHCDMIEDEISSQMPLPLYYGLAGTMAGAIIGLLSLVWGGAILELMTGSSGATEMLATGAANNINDLLRGIAIAMIASAIGIVLTSWNTVYFKNKKLQEETDRNKFLAWMQAQILPAVPSNVAQQMKALVSQLTTFNRNFKSNTDAIDATLTRANTVYQSQAKVMDEYRNIDWETIVAEVGKIVRKLSKSTESLDNFTQYLDMVRDYYNQMQDFAEKLNQETKRIGILEDIQKFFQSHKGVIAAETVQAEENLQDSIKAVQDQTQAQVQKTYEALTEQSQKLKDAVDENNKQFEKLCKDMRDKFEDQMKTIPSVAQNLESLKDLPDRLEATMKEIAEAQERMASDFLNASQKIVNVADKGPIEKTSDAPTETKRASIALPASIKWTVIISIVVIALATVANTVHNICKDKATPAIEVVEPSK